MANMAYLNAFVTQPPPKTSEVVFQKLYEEKTKYDEEEENLKKESLESISNKNTSENNDF
jgi:hypothetical protein